ncbi:hypothetical protein AB0I77_34050 [Streptomyces sp. NPDC050619]|uniref:hypothetical protein n=1 Tax=Streptomyces sp. NPDC050619 TaxID=3157214 RepID=UPI0034271F56
MRAEVPVAGGRRLEPVREAVREGVISAAELLQERGVLSMAPALPSCGEAGLPGGVGGPGLSEDVAAVRQVLRAGDEPTVVVAHSYSGIVTAEAAAGIGSVRHVGQSLSEFGDTSPARRADNVVELDAGHHPLLSQPAAVSRTYAPDSPLHTWRPAIPASWPVTSWTFWTPSRMSSRSASVSAPRATAATVPSTAS